MLTEICCDKFNKKKITLKEGLNVVLGTNNGDNSIGKSTFLMIIDYIFGGKTYSENEDIQKNVKEHTINYCFTFGRNKYYFSRSYSNSNQIWKCSNKYERLSQITLDEYKEWLKKQYGMDYLCGTFRNAVSRYLRVHGKGDSNPLTPFHNFNVGNMGKAIESLLDLFNEYIGIFEKKSENESLNKEIKAYDEAIKYEIVKTLNKNEYEKIKKELVSVEETINDYRKQFDFGIFDESTEKYKEANEIANKLSFARKSCNRIKNELFRLDENVKYKFPMSANTIDELKKFFPKANIKELKKINSFHNDISSIFKKEVKEEILSLERKYEEMKVIVKNYEEQLKDMKLSKNPSNQIIKSYEKYIIMKNEYQKLIAKYDDIETKKKEIKDSKRKISQLKISSIRKVEKLINKEIRNLTNELFGKDENCAIINMNDKSYSFGIPNDTGKGDSYRGLILCDLSVFKLSKLPIIIHDNDLLSEISIKNKEKIIMKYKDFKKQIFISYDKWQVLSNEVQNTLRDNAVLELGPNGKELFGYSWKDMK